MASHDACTSRTSQVLTGASLQQLKMEALIPAPADCEVKYVIKFLNALIEINRQLCQVYGHTWLKDQHISCRSLAGRCLIIIHPIALTSYPVISIFSYTSRNSCPISTHIFRMTERWRWVSQWFQSEMADFYKSWSHGMTNALNSRSEYVKNSSTLVVSVPIKNISIELGFVSVNGTRETYFVDMVCRSF